MLRWSIRIVALLVLAIGGLFWWLMLSGSDASGADPQAMDIEEWRTLALSVEGDLPTSISVLEVGRDMAPSFAAQAGRFEGPVSMTYNAVRVGYGDRHIVIGGAVDRSTAEGMMQSEADWMFDDEAYTRLTAEMLDADQVVITHEHLDHVMAVARHPQPEALASVLALNAPQIEALPLFAEGDLASVLQTLPPRLSGEIQAIAPGVVVIPAEGHTPGSQMVFVTLQNGEEMLLIGDIVWNMGSLFEQTIRPVLTQYIVFRPNYENRDAIKAQVRALYALSEAEPELTILPSHDRNWLLAKANETALDWGWN